MKWMSKWTWGLAIWLALAMEYKQTCHTVSPSMVCPLELLVPPCLDNSVLYRATAPSTQPQNKTCGVKRARWAEPRRATHDTEIRSFVVSHWNWGGGLYAATIRSNSTLQDHSHITSCLSCTCYLSKWWWSPTSHIWNNEYVCMQSTSDSTWPIGDTQWTQLLKFLWSIRQARCQYMRKWEFKFQEKAWSKMQTLSMDQVWLFWHISYWVAEGTWPMANTGKEVTRTWLYIFRHINLTPNVQNNICWKAENLVAWKSR